MTPQEHKKTYVVSSFTTKKLSFEGISFRTDEFAVNRQASTSRSSSPSPVNNLIYLSNFCFNDIY